MDSRAWFDLSAEAFERTLDGLPTSGWDSPALGVWDLRALLGHTTRALITVETYLRPATLGHGDLPDVDLPDAVAYYRAALSGAASGDAVADRGRRAGLALGRDPIGAAHEISARVRPLVAAAHPSDTAATPFGSIRLGDYLETRALELTVHSLDLCRATGADPHPALLEAAVPAIALCGRIAHGADRAIALELLTGRRAPSDPYSVL